MKIDPNKPIEKQPVLIVFLVLVTILGAFFIFGCNNDQDKQPQATQTQQTTNSENNEATSGPEQTTSKRDEFNQKVKEKFEKVAQEITELSDQGIYCFEDDCTVVYFDFNTIPDDLDMIIRSNAGILSKEKLEIMDVSHVSIIATKNGQTILTCDASGGKVDKCE